MTDAEILTGWTLLLLAIAVGLVGWLCSRLAERWEREAKRERWRQERVIGSVYALKRVPEHDEKGGE